MHCGPPWTRRRPPGICGSWCARCTRRAWAPRGRGRRCAKPWRAPTLRAPESASGLPMAGGERPGVDLRDELLKSEMDRAAREAAAERQLEEMKKKLRKD